MNSGDTKQNYPPLPSLKTVNTEQQSRHQLANQISESGDRHVKNSFLRWILFCCGWISVVAGFAGVFLPLVPTVPFLLLAVACFARSSERFHRWLVEHNLLGPLVRDYLNGAGMPLRAKRIAIGMIWVSFPATIFMFAQVFWLKMLLMILASGITLYLLYLPTAPERKSRAQVAKGVIAP